MGFLKTGQMTQAINALDGLGWGTVGAWMGAAGGLGVGMVSDDTSMLGGAFKGAVVGGFAGKAGMFASGMKGFRSGLGGDLNVGEDVFTNFMKEKPGGIGFRPTKDSATGGWNKAWYNQD